MGSRSNLNLGSVRPEQFVQIADINLVQTKEEGGLNQYNAKKQHALSQLSAESLLQVGAEMKFDDNALIAQALLETSFPEDFPPEKTPMKGPAPPSPEEVEKKNQKELLKYAEQVTESATESRDKVVAAIDDKKERAELSNMFKDQEQQATDNRPDWKTLEAKRRPSLLQLNANVMVDNGQVDEDADIAQAYLEHQFPDDYPKPLPPPPPAPKQPSSEELAIKARQELISYAESVTENATAFQAELKRKEIDRKEDKELAKMGRDDVFRPVYAPIAARVPLDERLVELDQETEINTSGALSQTPSNLANGGAKGPIGLEVFNDKTVADHMSKEQLQQLHTLDMQELDEDIEEEMDDEEEERDDAAAAKSGRKELDEQENQSEREEDEEEQKREQRAKETMNKNSK